MPTIVGEIVTGNLTPTLPIVSFLNLYGFPPRFGRPPIDTIGTVAPAGSDLDIASIFTTSPSVFEIKSTVIEAVIVDPGSADDPLLVVSVKLLGSAFAGGPINEMVSANKTTLVNRFTDCTLRSLLLS